MRGRLRIVGVGLLLGGLALTVRPAPGTSEGDVLRYGVSRTTIGGLAINWVLCPGEAPRTVRVGEDLGGSRTAAGVPVFWEIRSDRPANTVATVERYVVGETPAGFYQTIALLQPLPTDPTDLFSIDSPPGDAASTNGMGFGLADLPSSGIYRGNYETVSEDQFAKDGLRTCNRTAGADDPLLRLGHAIAFLGLVGLALTAGRRVVLVGAGVLLVAAFLTRTWPAVGPLPVLGARQAAPAFAPGRATVPVGRQILADLSPGSTAVHEVAPGFFVARILAPSDYAFVVSCGDLSVQISESSEIPDGGTGSREIIGCATPRPVRSGIGFRTDRAHLVEVSILSNGAAPWHLVVIDGSGEIGPFEEP
jgi:hypothetical protein